MMNVLIIFYDSTRGVLVKRRVADKKNELERREIIFRC